MGEWLGQEKVPFEDVLAQMADTFSSCEGSLEKGVTISDFLQPHLFKQVGIFFDCLTNLNKFIAFEQRDPYGDRQKREDAYDNDWERFAARDYAALSVDDEEEQDN